MKRVTQLAASLALIVSLTLAGTVRAGDHVHFKGQGSFTETGETVVRPRATLSSRPKSRRILSPGPNDRHRYTDPLRP